MSMVVAFILRSMLLRLHLLSQLQLVLPKPRVGNHMAREEIFAAVSTAGPVALQSARWLQEGGHKLWLLRESYGL